MMRVIALGCISFCLAGCASLSQPGSMFYSQGQKKKLSRAVTLMEERQQVAATELLAQICADPGIPGITDEALFRLSLLHLGSGTDRRQMARARQDLERLKREYPSSSWTPLAASLSAALGDMQGSAEDHHKQIRRLKELNLSLSRENRDLRQNIEKLKSLELELGRGRH